MPKATIEQTPEKPATTTAHVLPEGKLVQLRVDQIVLDPQTDVRSGVAPKDEDNRILALADTILDQGQLQPVVVRKNGADGHYLLVAGRRRYEAIKRIEKNLGGSYPIQAIVVEKNDEEAWSAAIHENLQRRQFSAIELAHTIQEVKKRKGLTGADWSNHVAKELRVSRATVTQHMKLLDLPEKTQAEIHSGEMSMQAALELATSVAPANQEKVLERATQIANEEAAAKPSRAAKTSQTTSTASKTQPTPQSGSKTKAVADADKGKTTPEKGKVTSKHVVAAARETDSLSAVKPRTRGEIVEFFETIMDSESAYPEPVVAFCKLLVTRWATGYASDRQLRNKLDIIAELCEERGKKGKRVA